MAIDTAAKRESAQQFDEPWGGWITPDGTISDSDKRAILFDYSGITSGAYVPPVTNSKRSGFMAGMGRMMHAAETR